MHLVIVCVSWRLVCIGATCRIERVESGERGAGSVQRGVESGVCVGVSCGKDESA